MVTGVVIAVLCPVVIVFVTMDVVVAVRGGLLLIVVSLVVFCEMPIVPIFFGSDGSVVLCVMSISFVSSTGIMLRVVELAVSAVLESDDRYRSEVSKGISSSGGLVVPIVVIILDSTVVTSGGVCSFSGITFV